MKITCRSASGKDIPVINNLAHSIWKEYYPSIISAEQIDYMLEKFYAPDVIQNEMEGGYRYYLSEADGEPVAYSSVQTTGDGLFLSKFYVRVSHHRHGIGKKLFDYIFRENEERRTIRLQVNRCNINAINFYFRLGFTIEKAADFDIGSGFFMNDFVMVHPGV